MMFETLKELGKSINNNDIEEMTILLGELYRLNEKREQDYIFLQEENKELNKNIEYLKNRYLKK